MSLLTKWAQPKVNGNLLDLFDSDRFWDNDAWFGRQLMQVPATNIEETDAAFIIEMAAPGLEKKDFHVDVKDNVLEIRVEKEQEEKKERKNYRRREYSFYAFNRSFTLPQTVKADNISALYENGILRLTVPKTTEAKTKPVKEIQVS